jgi:spore coat protein U-like protein
MDIKKVVKKVAIVAGFGMLGMMGADNAEAALAPGTNQPFTVTVLVDGTCTMTVASFDFTTYDYTNGNSDSNNFNVACTAPGIAYDVVFNVGTGAGATAAVRRMTNTSNADTLDYVLAFGGTPISDVVATATISATSGALPVDYAIDGTLAAGQPVSTGTYTDTVQAQLWY